MAVFGKIEQVKGGLAVVLPEEILSHLNIKENDTVEFVMSPNGLLLKLSDAQFERQMEAMRYVMQKHKDVLQMLAEGDLQGDQHLPHDSGLIRDFSMADLAENQRNME